MNFKRGFSYLEIIFIVFLLALFYSIFVHKFDQDEIKLQMISQKLTLYLKQTRIQAMIDNKFEPNNKEWQKRRWTLKFLRCDKNLGGLYFTVYSDKNQTGQINKEESLKDPLTNQYIYNNNRCNYIQDSSRDSLLTQEFDIVDVQISCNNTASLGQLSFGEEGELYSKLSINEDYYDHLVIKPCQIKLINKKGNYSTIKIEPFSGFIGRI